MKEINENYISIGVFKNMEKDQFVSLMEETNARNIGNNTFVYEIDSHVFLHDSNFDEDHIETDTVRLTFYFDGEANVYWNFIKGNTDVGSNQEDDISSCFEYIRK